MLSLQRKVKKQVRREMIEKLAEENKNNLGLPEEPDFSGLGRLVLFRRQRALLPAKLLLSDR